MAEKFEKNGNGEGSIYQRSDGRWVAALQVGVKAKVAYFTNYFVTCLSKSSSFPFVFAPYSGEHINLRLFLYQHGLIFR